MDFNGIWAVGPVNQAYGVIELRRFAELPEIFSGWGCECRQTLVLLSKVER